MQECVVNQALMHRILDSRPMLLVEYHRRFYFNAKVIDARGLPQLICAYTDPCSLRCQLMFAKILCCVKTGARAQRSKQKFRRSHALVMTAIFRRLIAHDGVLASLDFKLQRSEMFNGDFQHKNLQIYRIF